MAETKPTPKAGDPCPQCGGPFRAAKVPTDAQRAATANRENPTVLPPNSDSGTAEQIAELGVLQTCLGCGYQTRIKADNAKPALDANDEASAKTGPKALEQHAE